MIELYMYHEGDWNYHISDDYDTEYNIDGCILRTKDGSVTQYYGPSPSNLYQKIHPECIQIKNEFDIFFWFHVFFTFILDLNCIRIEVGNEKTELNGYDFFCYISSSTNSNKRIYINYDFQHLTVKHS